MARNYMNEIANMGFGGGGTSGYYSNMNRQYPGVGSLIQQGQKAANVKYLGNTASNLAKGNIKEAAKSGIGYALNQNPYIAGINTFNQLTGGIRFDKMLGLGPKKPKPTAAQQKAELDYQTMLEADRNRYLSGANRAADSAQRYEEYLNAERNAIRDLEQNGPSARSLAPMLGQFAAQNYASEGAARSANAANLSRRGISPTSGLALGAEAAVDTGLAATRGQQSSAIMNAVMDMLQQRRGAMLGIDAAGRKAAMDREESMMDTASTLGLKGREFDLTERRLTEARDQQMFERRQAEQRNLGQFAGQFGPAIMRELERNRNRGNQLPDTTEATNRIVSEFGRPEAYSDPLDYLNTGLAGSPMSATDIAAMARRPYEMSGPISNIVPNLTGTPIGTNIGPAQLPREGISAPTRVTASPLVMDFGLGAAPDTFVPQMYGKTDRTTLATDDADAMSDVFNMQNPYALPGQIIEFQGKFYRKTDFGWELIG